MMLAAAFRRTEAMGRLEDFAPVIVIHLALVTWFKDNANQNHWQKEIHAFLSILRRYDNAKKRAHNFTQEGIFEVLEEQILLNDDKDNLLISIEGHGVTAPPTPDWNALTEAMGRFAAQVVSDTAI